MASDSLASSPPNGSVPGSHPPLASPVDVDLPYELTTSEPQSWAPPPLVPPSQMTSPPPEPQPWSPPPPPPPPPTSEPQSWAPPPAPLPPPSDQQAWAPPPPPPARPVARPQPGTHSPAPGSATIQRTPDVGQAALENNRCQCVVRRTEGARAGLADHGAGQGHGADRAVGMREVDLPAHPQPDARADPRCRACRARCTLDGVDIYGPAIPRHRDPPPDRHGLPEAQPVPVDDHRPERARRPAALGHQGRQPRRAGPGVPRAGRAVARGAQPAERGRGRPLRWPAAAAVHRPGPGGAPPGAAHGRAVLGARPDLDRRHRGDHPSSSVTRSPS